MVKRIEQSDLEKATALVKADKERARRRWKSYRKRLRA